MTGGGQWHAWKAAVAGRSHRTARKRCQDFCGYRIVRGHGQSYAIGVVADGAGSAKHGRAGAEIACALLLRAARRLILANQRLTSIGRDQICEILRQARGIIVNRACGGQVRDFATTAAFAILGPNGCLFASVGDSVIVAGDQDSYLPVFWPENGEFAGTTTFLTEGDFEEHLQFETRPAPVAEVALFTDGLSPVALNVCEQKAHGPFFSPLFGQLRSTIRRRTPRFMVERGLRRFLGSGEMENRLDDDRSLVLICSRRQGKNDDNLLG